MAGALAHYEYVSDDGTTYRVKMDISNALSAGNTPMTAGPGLPHGYHPRYINASHPTTGRERRIIIGDPANALWVGTDVLVDLVDFGTTPSATVAYNALSRVGEKRFNNA